MLTNEFIQKYFLRLNYLIPYYSNGKFYNQMPMVFLPQQQYELLRQSNLILFLTEQNVVIRPAYGISANNNYKCNYSEWLIFIIPWIFIQTNFNYQQIETVIVNNIFNNNRIPHYQKYNVVCALLKDYVLGNDKQDKYFSPFLTNCANRIYSQFSPNTLRTYRRFLLRLCEKYLYNHVAYIYYFININTLDKIYSKTELANMKNSYTEFLSLFESFNTDIFYKFIDKLNALPGSFNMTSLKRLEAFAESLRRKRLYIDYQVKILELIDQIFKECNYSYSQLENILAKKFLAYLKNKS